MDTGFTIDSQNSEESSFDNIQEQRSISDNETIAETTSIPQSISDNPTIAEPTISSTGDNIEQSENDPNTNSDNTITTMPDQKKWLGGIAAKSSKRQANEIAAVGISVKKTERADLKENVKKTYYKVRENCIEGIKN